LCPRLVPSRYQGTQHYLENAKEPLSFCTLLKEDSRR
jgi:hypothetical protein